MGDNGIGAVGNRSSYFTQKDEEDMRNEPSTSAILEKARRDANAGGPSVNLRGNDESWRHTKAEQQRHIGVEGGAALAHGVLEGVHIAEHPWIEAHTAAAYAKDPAFHHGFDSLVWAKEKSASTDEYKATLNAMTSRDARYAQTSMTFRP